MTLNYKEMIKEFREQKKETHKQSQTLDYSHLKREYIQKKKKDQESKFSKSSTCSNSKEQINKSQKAEENFWDDIFGSIPTKENLC